MTWEETKPFSREAPDEKKLFECTKLLAHQGSCWAAAPMSVTSSSVVKLYRITGASLVDGCVWQDTLDPKYNY